MSTTGARTGARDFCTELSGEGVNGGGVENRNGRSPRPADRNHSALYRRGPARILTAAEEGKLQWPCHSTIRQTEGWSGKPSEWAGYGIPTLVGVQQDGSAR